MNLKEANEEAKAKLTKLMEERTRICKKKESFIIDVLDPIKEEMDLIEFEINRVMVESGFEKFAGKNYSVSMKTFNTVKITDQKILIDYALTNKEILLAKFFKTSKILNLMEEGVIVPGVKFESFDKIVFRKLNGG